MLQQPRILHTRLSDSLKKRQERACVRARVCVSLCLCVCVCVCVCVCATYGTGSAFLSLAETSNKAMEGIT